MTSGLSHEHVGALMSQGDCHKGCTGGLVAGTKYWRSRAQCVKSDIGWRPALARPTFFCQCLLPQRWKLGRLAFLTCSVFFRSGNLFLYNALCLKEPVRGRSISRAQAFICHSFPFIFAADQAGNRASSIFPKSSLISSQIRSLHFVEALASADTCNFL